MAQAAELVIVCQTLHRPVHDSNSTGDGTLQDRSSYFISGVSGLQKNRDTPFPLYQETAAKALVLQSVQTQVKF